MKAFEFETLIQKMRNAQKHYFSTRTREALEAARKIEKEVDTYLAEKYGVQTELFTGATSSPSNG